MFTEKEPSGWDLMDYLLKKKESHLMLTQMAKLDEKALTSWPKEELVKHILELHKTYAFVYSENTELNEQYNKLEYLWHRSTIYQPTNDENEKG